MREIKFRAKMSKTREWVVGSLIRQQMRGYKDSFCVLILDNVFTSNRIVAIDKETIGQFTGLQDRNGRDIFEGDIVRSTICSEFVYEVAYNDERFASFGLRRKQDAFMHYFGEAIEADECEVIGNVFDNPELLKKGVSNESDNRDSR